jgi:cell division protein FtsW
VTGTRNPPASGRPQRARSTGAPAQTAHPTVPGSGAARPRPTVVVVPIRRIFSSENRNYFLLLGTTLFLVLFGLVMVLSASSIESFTSAGDFFGQFVKQSLYAVIGVPLMLVASRLPVVFWKKWARTALVLAGALQLLVFTGLGIEYGGNRNWISIAGVGAQPSEFVKIALILWVAWVLATKRHVLDDWRQVLFPIGPIAGLVIGMVLLGNDLGTSFLLLMIVLGCVFFAGVKLRFMFVGVVGVVLVGLLASLSRTSRTGRISAWLSGCVAGDPNGYCWQPLHGNWALAAGGLFGRGLGNSTAKWNWLPEADNDFIFAIIGEELGLIGAIVVLGLFIVLAVAFLRIIRSTQDPFARIATSGVMVWVIGQAFVNIGVVLGVLPVLGVPLPLISAGGSALIATLLAIGVVLSFARNSGAAPEPAVVQSPADRSRLLAAERARQR